MALQALAASAVSDSSTETPAERLNRCARQVADCYLLALAKATPVQLARFLQDSGAVPVGQGLRVAHNHLHEVSNFSDALKITSIEEDFKTVALSVLREHDRELQKEWNEG